MRAEGEQGVRKRNIYHGMVSIAERRQRCANSVTELADGCGSSLPKSS